MNEPKIISNFAIKVLVDKFTLELLERFNLHHLSNYQIEQIRITIDNIFWDLVNKEIISIKE